MDPETAVFRFQAVDQVPQHVLVLAEDLGGSTDREHVTWRRHDQAPQSTRTTRQFQGKTAARSVALWSENFRRRPAGLPVPPDSVVGRTGGQAALKHQIVAGTP